jgi:hypothetical protein
MMLKYVVAILLLAASVHSQFHYLGKSEGDTTACYNSVWIPAPIIQGSGQPSIGSEYYISVVNTQQITAAHYASVCRGNQFDIMLLTGASGTRTILPQSITNTADCTLWVNASIIKFLQAGGGGNILYEQFNIPAEPVFIGVFIYHQIWHHWDGPEGHFLQSSAGLMVHIAQ